MPSIYIKVKIVKTSKYYLSSMRYYIVLTQKSTHWNPRASVRQAPESQPSVPVNLTCNWQGIKQSQNRERIGWDSEYLLHRRIGRLCRYRRQQKNIKCGCMINERVGRIGRCGKRQNQLMGADCMYTTRSKLRMCN